MNAKLQKQLAYRYKDKTHFKYVLVIPNEAINKLRWQTAQEIKLKVENNRLIAEAKSRKK
jgi:hypothetical protein